jgi:hypothetical protein
MPNAGIVLRPSLPGFTIIDRYYAAAPQEPTRRGLLPVNRVQPYRADFLHLVEAIRTARRSHVVVISHGSPELGLALPISPETNVSCASCFDDLRAVLDDWDSTGTLDTNRVQGFAQSWQLQSNTASRLVQALHFIRNTEDLCVALHVRGCNIGAQLANLRSLQRLFGSAVVSAPKCPMFYVPVTPSHGGLASATARQPLGRRFVYEDPAAGKMLLDIEYTGATSRSMAAVENLAAIGKWAKIVTQNQRVSAQQSFTVAGFYPDGDPNYYLAHDDGYVDCLEAVLS